MTSFAPEVIAGAAGLAVSSGPLLRRAAERLRIEPTGPADAPSGWARFGPGIALASAVVVAGVLAPTPEAFVVFVCGGGLLVIASLVDLAEQRIPDRITVPAMAVCSGLALTVIWEQAWSEAAQSAVVGSAVFGTILLALHLARPDAMGFGDVKLALPLGFAIGWAVRDAAMAPAAIGGALVAASLLGLAMAAVAPIVKADRRRDPLRHRSIPFAPALSTGGVAAIAFALWLS